jgi:hypothetical protein
MTLDYSIAHILGRPSHKVQYDREFVKQHFERLALVNELGQKKGTKKTDERLVADFKQRLTFEEAASDKEAEKKK